MEGEPSPLHDYIAIQVEPTFLVISGAIIIFTNVLAVFLHFFRSSSCFGMLLMLLITNIVYAILIVCCGIARNMPTPKSVVSMSKILAFKSLTPIAAQQIVAISSSLLALDRVILMTFPVTYKFSKISLKLSLTTICLNVAILASLCGPLLDMNAFYGIFRQMKFICIMYLYPLSMLAETLFSIMFMFKFRKFVNSNVEDFIKREAKQNNHIVLCQTLCHTLINAFPNILIAVDNVFNIEPFYHYYVVPFEMFYCAISVTLSSLFTLYKIIPKRSVFKVSNSRAVT
ncbi:hypothetical protein L596_008778 [Steinernema carpocapsae]|uniref:G-protein coupled receptors family 1 profile domain-containing protein n=1 Tax=Steinernema carpocapsae TaxID=34508 RepID=A0A4U5PE04_STECR|nr:hypothetical protein L596_008778 [Steinernema carpocapsae]